ncbi:MAG: Uma2 family endonuclease [Bacteroidetes bacterium]|nr:MAG: Uma2 family endonuclease [Bacteroidota bacterium]
MITDINQLDIHQKYTYADYLTWRFADRVELIKGWIKRMSPAPLDRHQRISNNLSYEVNSYFRKGPCQVRVAPYDVRLPDRKNATTDKEIYTVVQPDICVICDESKIDRRGCVGAPDWVIEILSPGNTRLEMHEKFDLYEENGVVEYWTVHSEDENIMQFVLDGEKFRLEKIYVPGQTITPVLFPNLTIETDDVLA